jgi:hypothetical protein
MGCALDYMPSRLAPTPFAAAKKANVTLSAEQEASVEDWTQIQNAMFSARQKNDGHTVARMHAFMQGAGMKTTPKYDALTISQDVGFHGPKLAFELGGAADLGQADFAFKRVIQMITIWPESQRQNQYDIVSFEAKGDGVTWWARAVKAGGKDPKEWTLTRKGDQLDVVGESNSRRLVVDEEGGRIKVYREGDIVKALELHSYAKDFGIETKPTKLEKRLFLEKRKALREAGNGYELAKVDYHLVNLRIIPDVAEDEGLIRGEFGRFTRRKSQNGEQLAGLIMFMKRLGMELSAAEMNKAEPIVREALRYNRRNTREGESAAWLRFALRDVWGDPGIGEQLEKIQPEILQTVMGDPMPDTMVWGRLAPPQDTETWSIDYDMQTNAGVVHVREPLPLRGGYQDRMKKGFAEYPGGQDEKLQPLYKVRGNGIVLADFESFLGNGAGRILPLTSRRDIAGGQLLASKENPIILTAPDGTRYVREEF